MRPRRCPRRSSPSGPTCSSAAGCRRARRCWSTAARAASAPRPSRWRGPAAPACCHRGLAREVRGLRAPGRRARHPLPRGGLRGRGHGAHGGRAAWTSCSTWWAATTSPRNLDVPGPRGPAGADRVPAAAQGRARPAADHAEAADHHRLHPAAAQLEEKGAIARALREHVWPLLEHGRVRPVIHATLPAGQAAEAHRLMESDAHIGKIVLVVGECRNPTATVNNAPRSAGLWPASATVTTPFQSPTPFYP